jgi:hypothetical protein
MRSSSMYCREGHLRHRRDLAIICYTSPPRISPLEKAANTSLPCQQRLPALPPGLVPVSSGAPSTHHPSIYSSSSLPPPPPPCFIFPSLNTSSTLALNGLFGR